MPETPFGRLENSEPPVSEATDIAAAINQRVPGLREAEWSVTYEQLALVAQVAGDSNTHDAVRILFNLAVNDFRDLMRDLNDGSGRSAMRAARTLIEHAINMHTR